ncbi:hypothetical protein MtrunA17_Chr1g0205851 [Medicago truncatula]|uniref:Uncharacterized protein n=1 Tax=Medicago truncatula TaxID=3880 RepID=A0A396K2F0_MEDTR|nr:hypothetical protein MtrunA17_Chr1g0205851 [Medicago truncatula]
MLWNSSVIQTILLLNHSQESGCDPSVIREQQLSKTHHTFPSSLETQLMLPPCLVFFDQHHHPYHWICRKVDLRRQR